MGCGIVKEENVSISKAHNTKGCGNVKEENVPISKPDKTIKIPNSKDKEKKTNSKQFNVIRGKIKGEIINIGAGGSGTNSLISFFDEIAKEHELYNGGITDVDKNFVENINTFFSETKGKLLLARGIIIDSGEDILKNEPMKAPIGKFFNPTNIVTNSFKTESDYYKSSANSVLVNQALDTIRKEIEKCDHLSGFQLFNSLGGGAGSAYGLGILIQLSEKYPSRIKLNHVIIPSLKDSNSFNIANTINYLAKIVETCEVANILSNESMLSLVKKLPDTNRLIGKMAADLTCLYRFSSKSNFSLEQIYNTMVPFPRMHFLSTTLVDPIDPKWKETEIINKLFDDKKCLGFINSANGKYLSYYQIFRGSQLNKYEILNSNVAKSSSLNFFLSKNNSGNGFSTIKCNSCIRIANHTSIIELFQKYLDKKGNPDGNLEMVESTSNLEDLISEYKNYGDAGEEEANEGQEEA